MNKHIILSICFLIVFYPLYSQTVSRQEAEEFALKVLRHQQADTASQEKPRLAPEIRNTHLDIIERLGLMYFIQTISDGWMVVSADKRITPILAMGDGIFSTSGDYPPAMVALFQSYADEIKYIRDSTHIVTQHPDWSRYLNISPASEDRSGPSMYIVGTDLLNKPNRGGEIKWCQYEPYNKYAYYTGYDGRFPDGFPAECTAIAIAQIMWYWQWPHTAYIPAYIDSKGNTSGPINLNIYNWDLMPASININSDEAYKEEIARFIRDCGYSIHIEYDTSGSGASNYDVLSALQNTFAFKKDAVIKNKANHKNSWVDMIKNEIRVCHPIYYTGRDIKKDIGHSFVVSGFNHFDKFYINWGGEEIKMDSLN